MNAIEIAVLDMAGTTVQDDGLVEQAFTAAIGSVGVAEDSPRFPEMLEYVRTTMGESKISVFTHLATRSLWSTSEPPSCQSPVWISSRPSINAHNAATFSRMRLP